MMPARLVTFVALKGEFMDPEVNVEGATAHRIPADVAGLDRGRTSYLSAEALRAMNLEAVASIAVAAASPKGSPKPKPKPASPKGSPKPKPPSPKGSPKP
jgi:hypothetical protein